MSISTSEVCYVGLPQGMAEISLRGRRTKGREGELNASAKRDHWDLGGKPARTLLFSSFFTSTR